VTTALAGVTLQVKEGEFVAILGPSGSGKSTLLNMIGALDSPTDGEIQIAGTSLRNMEPNDLARVRGKHLGFIFQFHHLLPDFTALENVMMSCELAGELDSDKNRKVATEVLERVGLGERLNSLPKQLSGGQQQRASIARALARRPSIVLADEPTGNLDTKNGQAVFQLMREFCDQDGTAFLIVTHDPRLAAQADRIIEVVDGLIASDRPNTPQI
jgi:lipoprotein-releasing system ATP-binding protein